MSIGKSVTRPDAVSKVKGEPVFASDIHLENELHMKVRFAHIPHAIIKSVDTSKAEETEGVVAVLTAKDIPGKNEYGYIILDQPVLCGPGSEKEGADRVRFPYDHIALVIAETEEAAEQARDLIDVEYEELPLLDDPEAARKENAFLIHPEMGDSNVFHDAHIHRGNVDRAFEEADVIVEGNYYTPAQEHVYLEPDNGIAWVKNGVVTIIAPGQCPHWDRQQVCHVLDLPPEKVRVIYKMIGGAFGGREDVSVQIILGLAAQHLEKIGDSRPVRITWNREEVTCGHGKRHPFHIRAKWGAKKDGTITAAEVEMLIDCGAYVYTSTFVAGSGSLNATGPYEIPNVRLDAHDVFTNSIPKAAMRGFGAPQSTFEHEMQIEKLAKALNMDPIQLRMKNLYREGSIQPTGGPIPPGVSIVETAADCAERAGWTEKDGEWSRNVFNRDIPGEPHKKRGYGFACSIKNVTFGFGFQEFCGCVVELFGKDHIEKAVIRHGGTEDGQGIHSALVQMAAFALSIPPERVEIIVSDTGECPDAFSASGSRMTFVTGNAVKEACELALDKWFSGERPVAVEHKWLGSKTTPRDEVTGACNPNLSYGYTAVYAEVEVNTETGEVTITRLICSDDVGKAINPQQVEGQLEGGLAHAIGFTLIENFIEKTGCVLTPNLSTYLVPLAPDMPEKAEISILEFADPRGPWGARGVGEMATVCTPPAIVSAVNRAIGTDFGKMPLVPEKVFFGLHK